MALAPIWTLPLLLMWRGGPAMNHEGTCRRPDAIAGASRECGSPMIRLGSRCTTLKHRSDPSITEKGLDSRNMILCTDDIAIPALW